ncbi:MAG: glycosyltransferase family 39 protein [Acinetobacter sp.]|nr:glycosyltransferase family 39 protein [Acinetobacter sp.]
MTKIKNFVLKHPELFTILGLTILFYFIFFHNIWAYALMDVDESRYVSMSKDMFHTKDFLTLYLNKQFFFEKPPLYFWGECLSFAFWGRVTEFTARFPVALDGMLCCFTVYFLGKRIISRGYGVVSSLIFATSLEFLILAKFAILDIVVATCIGFSLCFGIFTNFCQEKHKKYCWWLFYIFSGLAVMAKGIPGFVIPFGSMFFISLYSKNFKEIFKPLYFIPSIILFLLITLPWHIIMLKMHDPLFFEEYIVKHHIERFIGGNELGREQPFYFYILTLLWGFFPWIFSVLAVFIRKIVKKDFVFKNVTNIQKFLVYNGIITLFVLVFFSASDTKLVTYILPIYGSLACLGGYIWTRYIEKGEYSKIINITVYILGGIFILASIIALFTPLYLPAQLNSDIASAKPLCISLLFIAGLASIIFAKKEKYIGVFFTYVLFMLILSAFGTEKFFEIDYKFGQDDLMRFAEYAKVHNKTLTAYKFDRKYSLIFYSGQPVEYGLFYNIEDLKNELKEQNNLVIVQYKHMNKDFKNLNYKVIDKGRKYMLIEKR